ncbi:beta-lactamase class A [Allokutzneria albata]|uniref:Beta-lactamase n=1 Tax=Allokutzneria albata TaxID=211114 RepID=A0A1G9UHZ2_ALLAB|nr:beta-lactamase class A [Allokutzneria albata]
MPYARRRGPVPDRARPAGPRHAQGAPGQADPTPEAQPRQRATPTTHPTSRTLLLPACGTSQPDFTALEKQFGARLGVFAIDTATGKTVSHRENDRFAMASTFKAYAVAALLKRHGTEVLSKRVHFTQQEIVTYSPVTEKHVGTGMTVGELCGAAITKSDNTAGNQMLKLLGGPGELTKFAKSIGDGTTRLDRWETELNTAIPGDERDTSTPKALGSAYRDLVVGDVLPPAEREQLKKWLLTNTTGGERLRAGIPKEWSIGEKTGTGDYASANDVGVAWTEKGTPIAIAVLTTKDTKDAKADNALLARTAKLIVEALR